MPKASKKSNRLTFPVRLHGLLSQAEIFGVDHIISWDEEGTRFSIHNQKLFVSNILPNVFKQSKFASFRRQLNAYGFERVFTPIKQTSCADSSSIIYSRKDFTRDDPSACERISRRYSNQTLAEGIARLSSNGDVVIDTSLFKNSSSRETSDSSPAYSMMTCPQACLSSSSTSMSMPFCPSQQTISYDDAAIVSEDESVVMPSLVRASSGSSVESFTSSIKPQSCISADPTDAVLDEMLALFDDNDTPFNLSYQSMNDLSSWDPLVESLTGI